MLILLGETGETANLSFFAGRLCQTASDETIGAKSIGLAILFFQQKIASVKVKGRDLSVIAPVQHFLFLQFLGSIRDSAVNGSSMFYPQLGKQHYGIIQ